MIHKVKYKWTDIEQKVFDEIKCIVSCDTLLIYPDFFKGFDIHMDDSDFQKEALIRKDGKPMAFYSRKPT